MKGLLGDAARGLVRGVTADFAGAPVDTLNAIRSGLLGPAQAGNPYAAALGGLLGPVQQVGSGDWIAQQMGLPQGSGMVYETARMLAPSPTEMLNLARRVPLQDLITYHGTPHRFEATPENPLGEFRASQIGTGEGAQAYGHGIYVAESPEVAKSYVSAGGSRTTKPGAYAADIVGMMGGEQKALAHLKSIMPKKGETTFSGESPELIEQAIKNIESGAYKARQGNLYTADLPDEMIDRMLDWDKPLSEQPEAVREALTTLARSDEQLMRLFRDLGPSAPANQAYAALTQQAVRLKKYEGMRAGIPEAEAMPSLSYGQEVASRQLNELGIPGIKYLDAGSRGDKAKPTRNFVIFPGEEKKVKILKRE